MFDQMLLMKDLSENQRLMFMSEFNQRRKDATTGILLALFLGGLGLHRFYLGQVGLGIVYLIFCWTFIPAFIGLIEAILMKGRVDRYNERAATDIAMRVRALAATA